jgi:uncharacterized membrane protein
MSTATAEIGAIPIAAPAPRARARIDSVDLLRGLVMVIMLLDHTRDFVHADGLVFDPTDLTRTTPILFFTRWITHFCAPIFVFLAGTSIALQLARGKPKPELSRFLVTRGLWLIVLEFTVIRAAVAFDFDTTSLGFIQVIWAIGVSMIVLAGLIHLPFRAVAAIGVAIVLLHNAADGIRVQGWAGPGSPAPGFWESIWMVLHQPGFILVLGRPLLVLYPVLPWIGVMVAGYALGAVYGWEPARRRRFLVRLGVAMIAAFVALRFLGVYGEQIPFTTQKNGVFTLLSFLNTSKYPPSLLFTLMTLGPAMLALAWFERTERGPVGRALVTYGRVPLFFYILQWLTSHSLGILFSLMAGKPIAHLLAFPGSVRPVPAGAGFSLGVVYATWLLGIVITYPLCRWFAEVKRRRTDWWLSYL